MKRENVKKSHHRRWSCVCFGSFNALSWRLSYARADGQKMSFARRLKKKTTGVHAEIVTNYSFPGGFANEGLQMRPKIQIPSIGLFTSDLTVA